MNPAKKLILSIETSCDETAAAVLELRDNRSWPKIRTLSSIVKSQIQLHGKFGGVVPEAAARAHVKNILPVVKTALSTSHLAVSTIDCIAVTAGPGLISSLIVGVEFARGLSYALKKPVIPVNHLLGHLYSPFARFSSPPGRRIRGEGLFPMISLIVSGGHTILVIMENIKKHRVLGQTVDDAAGEAFDKVAKLLKLPYPGGPEVAKLAMMSKSPVNFPRPMLTAKNYNFSFSGLKTAVLYYIQALSAKHLALSTKQNICAGFQNAAVDVLVTKTLRAAKQFKARSISLSGGVSANLDLRQAFALKTKDLRLKFFVPPTNLCTDNAEIIGLAAAFMLHNGYRPKSYKQIKADANLSI